MRAIVLVLASPVDVMSQRGLALSKKWVAAPAENAAPGNTAGAIRASGFRRGRYLHSYVASPVLHVRGKFRLKTSCCEPKQMHVQPELAHVPPGCSL